MSMLPLMMPTLWQNASPRREAKTVAEMPVAWHFTISNSLTLLCYVTTSADPFNLLSDIIEVQLVATLLCYNSELCTSTLTADTPKEGYDNFLLTNLNLLLLLLLIFRVSKKSRDIHTHGRYSSEFMPFLCCFKSKTYRNPCKIRMQK
jgi:hypothetical protein